MTIDRKPARGKSKGNQECSQAIAAFIGASKLTGARIVAWMAATMGILTGAFFMGFPSHAPPSGMLWRAVAVALGLTYLVFVVRPCAAAVRR